MSRQLLALFTGILLALALVLALDAAAYDILFVSSPRPGGDATRSRMPDADHTLGYEPGTDLRLLRAGQTTPEILVDTAGKGVVLDPYVSYDGTQVYYSLCPDFTPTGLNQARSRLPYQGCNLWRMDLATRQATMFVGQNVWHPSESMTTWSARPDKAEPPGTSYLGYGIINVSPVPLPNGDVFFTSNLAGYDIIKGFAQPSSQGYIWHADTQTIEQVWFPPTIILHPTTLSHTGEIAFATLENSLPDAKPHRWGIWAMTPYGADWHPLFSATMEGPHTRHFHTEYGGNLIVTSYYITNNAGMGTLVQRPLYFGTTPAAPEFGSPTARQNTPVQMGPGQKRYWAYKPAGTDTLTPWAHTFDKISDKVNGAHVGKAGYPWAAPDGLLVSYSAGPAHYGNAPDAVPALQLGLYLLPGGQPTDSPADLRLIYDDPQRNEFYARPIVPYKAIYGMDAPKALPTRAPNDGTAHPLLLPGTPYGIVGTSSVWHRESCGGQWTPGWQCAKPAYAIEDETHSNRAWQGVDTHKFAHTDIAALRVIAQGGVSHLTYGPGAGGVAYTHTFVAHAGNERLHVLGDVPLYKKDAQGKPIMDTMGNPDTSFLARIPCQTSFGFQLIDSTGMALTQPGTWHQIACGAVQTNCGGCHAHNSTPLDIATTAAGKAGFVPTELTQGQPWTKEYHRDIKPIIEAKCVSCHNPTTNAGNIDLQTATVTFKLPRPWYVLGKDRDGLLSGVKPIRTYSGRASRYIARMAAAESPLAWVIAGKRLDKVANDARPTETTLGDASTLPPGTYHALVDIDYRPQVQAAHASLGLSAAEVQAIVHWIDMGVPIDIDAKRGWMADEWRPIVAWHDSGQQISLGLHDVGTGLNTASLTITRDGQAVTAQSIGDGRWNVPRQPGRYEVKVYDNAGNSQRLTRLVVGGTPVVTPGQTLYERCQMTFPWDTLSSIQHQNWEACSK